MKAVILNSGMGRRLANLTADKPKCLLELGEQETILSRQIRILTQAGISQIVMTTGPFASRLRDYVKKQFPDLLVIFIHNSRFDTTNYIYSLFLTRDAVSGDCLLLHGDMVFSESALKKLRTSTSQNGVLARKTRRMPEKDFKGRIKGGQVMEIAVTLKGKECLEIFPIYKLSSCGWQTWMAEVERWVKRGRTDVYAEEAFNRVSEELSLGPVPLGNCLCMEIDTVADLHKAQNRVRRRGRE